MSESFVLTCAFDSPKVGLSIFVLHYLLFYFLKKVDKISHKSKLMSFQGVPSKHQLLETMDQKS